MLSKKDIKSLNVGIVYSRFNEPVVKELLNSCVDQLILEGIDENHILKKEVPGALEIPMMINAKTFSLFNETRNLCALLTKTLN